MIALMFAGSALAEPAAGGQSAFQQEPYVDPKLGVNVVSFNGTTFAQARAGLELGMKWLYHDTNPKLAGRYRTVGTAWYGITSNTLGGEIRVGGFGGPTSKLATWEFGPDVWYSGYVPAAGSVDFEIPWSPGLDLRNALLFHPAREFQLLGVATPGWAFDSSRQGGGLGPFHTFQLGAVAQIATDNFSLAIGYMKTWDAYGESAGLVLGGGIGL